VGYEDVKHPFFGRGIPDIFSRQTFISFFDGGWALAFGAVVVGDAAVTRNWARAKTHDKKTTRPMTFVPHPHTEIELFTAYLVFLSKLNRTFAFLEVEIKKAF
jgi:hypothetical protein